MSYQTILVHLNDERDCERMLNVACDLARRFEAHLIGLHVTPPLVLPPAVEVPYGSDILETNRKQAKKSTGQIREMFEKTIANQPFVGEWRAMYPHAAPVAAVVAEQIRNVDIGIVSQDAPDRITGNNDVVERAAFESGRPVLIVPTSGQFPDLGRRVLIAWNGRREAARAVFDSLPLLKRADKVHILSINPQKEKDTVDIPGAEIAAVLARHGVKCEAAQTLATGISVGDTLLNFSAEHGIDLIVMGCYGHSRLHEFVFGGATRNILAHMTAPVLMSH